MENVMKVIKNLPTNLTVIENHERKQGSIRASHNADAPLYSLVDIGTLPHGTIIDGTYMVRLANKGCYYIQCQFAPNNFEVKPTKKVYVLIKDDK